MATTLYYVTTVYNVDDRTSGALQRMGVTAGRTDRMMSQLRQTTRHLVSTMSPMAGLAMGSAGGMTVLATAIAAVAPAAYGMVRGLKSVNEEMEGTLSIAARLSASFTYAANPVDDFAMSLRHAQQLTRQLALDARELPGTASDFQKMFSAISGPASGAGIRPERQLEMVRKLAIVSPMSQGSPEEAGRQMMRMLGGNASVGDNPLFVTLLPFLRGAGGGQLNAKSFNALAPQQRFEAANRALAQLSDNPMFKEQRIRTLTVQWSTFSDQLFGSQGLFGQLARPAYFPLVDALTRINKELETATPKIVDFFDNLLAHSKALTEAGRAMTERGSAKGSDMLKKPPMYGSIVGQRVSDWATEKFYETDYGKTYRETLEVSRMRSMVEREVPEEKFDPGVNNLANQPPVQNIEVHVDLKSDVSPEAVAVRIREGVSRAAKHPSMSRRALSYDPTP